MSSFCGKCGTQLRAGAKFCQACGTRVEQPPAESLPPTMHMASTPPPPAPSFASAEPRPSTPLNSYEPPAYVPQYNPMPVAEKKKSGGVLKAVVITLVIFGVLVVTAVGGIFFFVRRAINNKIERASREGFELPLPEGNVKIGGNTDISEEKLGVPIYKPSDKASGQNLSVSGESPEGKGTFTIATFTTESSVEEVQSFYREKLGDKLRITETHGGENKVHMVLENEEGLRTIEISEDEASGKTKFVITSALGTKSKGGRNKMPPPANPLPPESIPLPPPPQGPPPPPR